MEALEKLQEDFRLKYDKLMKGCGIQYKLWTWDVEDFGDLDRHYHVLLIVLLLYLTVKNGTVEEADAGYLNETFGFSYDKDDLASIYGVYRNVMEPEEYEAMFIRNLEHMRFVEKNLFRRYLDVLETTCEIILRSGRGVNGTAEKTHRIRELMRRFNTAV